MVGGAAPGWMGGEGLASSSASGNNASFLHPTSSRGEGLSSVLRVKLSVYATGGASVGSKPKAS